jgi:hypothetical protein
VLHNEIARISWISESLADLVILAMIYSYLGRSAKIHVLNKLISKRAYDLASLNFLYGNFNIIYIKNGEYAVPSSIFSREMLKSLFHADRIKAVIENSFIKSSEFGNHEFSDFRRDVMQYGSLQRILVRPGGSPDLDNIISLFRSFADTGIEKGNIHFWQQYSIALYINEEFELSQKRLDTAKSLAREMSYYDTFMLDHHQARLLVVSRARRVNEYKDHEEAYVEALQTAVRLISEHLGEAFAGEALSIVKNSTRVKLALQAMLEAVSNRKPNASVGLSLLRRTVRDIRLALDALTQPE